MTLPATPERESLSRVIATRVRGLLAERSLTYEDLGVRMDLSKGAISDRLRGRTKFDVDELHELADFLGVRLEYLLGLSEQRGAPVTPVAIQAVSGDVNPGSIRFLVRPDGGLSNPRTTAPNPVNPVVKPDRLSPEDEPGERWADVLPFRRRAQRISVFGRSAS